MKKIISVFLILILMISTVAFATDETNLPLEDTSLIDSMDDIN